MVKTAEVDFTQLANPINLAKQGHVGGLLFSSSSCGQYLVAARASKVYVYFLSVGKVAPIGHVVCPRDVVTIEIDVSDGRITIAALLEAKMGVMYESEVKPRRSKNNEDADRKTGLIAAIHVHSDDDLIALEGTDKQETYEENMINQT